MNCIICNGKINEDDDDFLEAGIDCYVCWLDVYRAKIAELEAALRPAKGLPTWRELVETAIVHDYQFGLGEGEDSTSRASAMAVFALDDHEADQLCAALGRDPETGEKLGEE